MRDSTSALSARSLINSTAGLNALIRDSTALSRVSTISSHIV